MHPLIGKGGLTVYVKILAPLPHDWGRGVGGLGGSIPGTSFTLYTDNMVYTF